MDEALDKGSIRFLEKYIIKHDRKYNLEVIATKFPNIDKWIADVNIDNELSNEYWTNKHITNSQKACLLNLDMVNIWAMLESNYFLIERPTPQ